MKETTPAIQFFTTPAAWREWLEKNHEKAAELWVGFYKTGSKQPSITWPESVSEALCFGWIDGIRKTIDEHSYKIRFTPRRPGSMWSAVNIKKIAELTAQGRMYPAGITVFQNRKEGNTNGYSYSQEKIALNDAFEKTFRKNKKAWEFFRSQAPSYQNVAIHWIMSAKQEPTRIKRLETLISDSAAGLRLAHQRRK